MGNFQQRGLVGRAGVQLIGERQVNGVFFNNRVIAARPGQLSNIFIGVKR